MAAPNIINVATITGKTAYVTPANTNATILLANAAASGKVFKVNLILAANLDGTNPYNATVAYNTVAAGSGTSYAIASTISVPANATLVIADKTASFYVEEDKSVVVTSSGANKVTFFISYEELADAA